MSARCTFSPPQRTCVDLAEYFSGELHSRWECTETDGGSAHRAPLPLPPSVAARHHGQSHAVYEAVAPAPVYGKPHQICGQVHIAAWSGRRNDGGRVRSGWAASLPSCVWRPRGSDGHRQQPQEAHEQEGARARARQAPRDGARLVTMATRAQLLRDLTGEGPPAHAETPMAAVGPTTKPARVATARSPTRRRRRPAGRAMQRTAATRSRVRRPRPKRSARATRHYRAAWRSLRARRPANTGRSCRAALHASRCAPAGAPVVGRGADGGGGPTATAGCPRPTPPSTAPHSRATPSHPPSWLPRARDSSTSSRSARR